MLIRYVRRFVNQLTRGSARIPAKRSTPLVRPSLEGLEDRVCPSSIHDYAVIGQTGQAGLTGIEQGASINDAGNVAFIGDKTAGKGIYFWDQSAGTLTNVDSGFVSSIRSPYPELQLNNSDQVATVDRFNFVSGDVTWGARIWDARQSDKFRSIAEG